MRIAAEEARDVGELLIVTEEVHDLFAPVEESLRGSSQTEVWKRKVIKYGRGQ